MMIIKLSLSDKEWVSYPLAAIVYFPLVSEFPGDLLFFKIGDKQISREIGIPSYIWGGRLGNDYFNFRN